MQIIQKWRDRCLFNNTCQPIPTLEITVSRMEQVSTSLLKVEYNHLFLHNKYVQTRLYI